MLTEQEQFWAKDFGTEYTRRNANIDWRARVPFWQDIINRTQAKSVLEAGCNVGANLKALRAVDPWSSFKINACGCDINQAALQEAADAGLAVVEASLFDLKKEWPHPEGAFDLVFTAGVLIHIHGDDLPRAMDSITSVSNRYVLAVEYADETEVEVPYRGHTERLWRRPFGKLYQERGLTMVAEGEAPADAFDRCYWWLLSK